MPMSGSYEDSIRSLLSMRAAGQPQEVMRNRRPLSADFRPAPQDSPPDAPPPQPSPARPQRPFEDTIPSLEDINTPVYEADSEMPFGPKGVTLTPPPEPGRRDKIAAAHQRRMGR